MPEAVLAANGVSKLFGGKRALSDASIVLHRNEVHGIIGPNGSGKSTFINVISGALKPDGGTVVIDQRNVSRLSARRRSRCGIGRTYQTPQIFESLTLRQHIALNAAPAVDNWGLEAAAFLRLEPQLDRPVGAFSHALRRMAELCHVAAARPRVVLLDEPAAGLSAPEMGMLARLVLWLRERTAVCLVEHNMKFLLDLADRVTVLEHGNIIASGTPDEIIANANVRRAYLGSDFTRPAT